MGSLFDKCYCYYRNPIARIYPPQTILKTKPAPEMAAFSSMGPNIITADIIRVSCIILFQIMYSHRNWIIFEIQYQRQKGKPKLEGVTAVILKMSNRK